MKNILMKEVKMTYSSSYVMGMALAFDWTGLSLPYKICSLVWTISGSEKISGKNSPA